MNRKATLKKVFIASIILMLFVPSIFSSTTRIGAITHEGFLQNTIEQLTNLIYTNIEVKSSNLSINQPPSPLSLMATTSEVIISVTWAEYSGENKAELYDPAGNLLASICDPSACYNASGTNSSYNNTNAFSACLTDATGYYVIVYDTYGDGWSGTSNITVTSGGVSVVIDNGPPSNGSTGVTTQTISFDVFGGGVSCNETNSCFGNADAVITETGITYNTANQTAVLDGTDGNHAQLYEDTDVLTLDLADIINAGETYNIVWRRKSTYTFGPFADLIIEESLDNATYTTNATSPSTDQQSFITTTITAGIDTRYIRITLATASNDDADVDAIYYNGIECGGTVNQGDTPIGNLTCSAGVNEITGTIFEDFNYNGIFNSGEYLGIENITVTATDSLNNTITTTTAANGTYTLSGLTASRTYRVEFTNIPSYLSPTFYAGDNGTVIQFLQSGACANLGLANPNDYCQSNPEFFSVCFVEGEPLGGGTSGDGDVLISAPSNASGVNPSLINKIAKNSETGTVWGLAFNRSEQTIFASAFMKRHSGFGPLGIGGIYAIDYSNTGSPIISNWLDVNLLSGVSVGTDPRNYSLPANVSVGNNDSLAFDAVGKVGIGDIDISADDQTLYVMNLNNNGELLIIDIASKTLISSISVPNPGCGNNSDVRPFAVNVHKGEVYIGLICSGENAGVSDLHYYIMRLSGNTLISVTDGDLNYTKGAVHATYNSPNPPVVCTDWETWTSDFSNLNQAGVSGAGPRICRPQPILSDFEFDDDGSIILGFVDRTGHQTGFLQYGTTGSTTNNGYTGGDILRIYNNNGTFELESGGTTSNGGGCGANGQGPGGGEFYCGENFSTDNDGNGTLEEIHEETSHGGLAILRGTNTIVLSIMDPVNVFSGGIKKFSNTTGQTVQSFQVFQTTAGDAGTFGKAAGLGDVEIVCNPAPIEIGNYVWLDTNSDGVQDAGEAGIENIRVELYDAAGTFLAFDSTNALGQYYFSGNTIDGAIWQTANDTLLANTVYYIIAGGNGQFSSGALTVNGTVYNLTQDSTNSGTNRYEIDSDGTIASGIDPDFDGKPYVQITTGNIGEVNHTFDFGFRPSCAPTASVFAIQSSCDNNIVQSDGYLQISAYANGDKYNFSTGSTYTGDTDYANALVIGALPFQFNTGIPNPTGSQAYTVRIFNGDSTCFTDFTVNMTEQDCTTGCDCNDYVYLNDIDNSEVHKFSVSGGLQEVGSPWLNGGTINSPHGISTDQNGFIYIGNVSSFPGTVGNIVKMDCDANVIETNISGPTHFAYNHGSVDNLLYLPVTGTDSIQVWDVCTGTKVNSIITTTEVSWGFTMSNDEQYYYRTNGWWRSVNNQVFRGNADGTGSETVIYTGSTTGTYMGITQDDSGNIYVVECEQNNGTGEARILKIAADGTLLGTSPWDNTLTQTDGVTSGYYGARGITWSGQTNRLYVGAFEDCIAVFDTSLNYLSGESIGYVPASQPKGISLLKECCPTNNNITVDTTFCENVLNTKLFLQELINCDGSICEGLWTAGGSNTGLTYDVCDNSVTITSAIACGSFTLESDGTGNNPQCGAFKITVNIEVENITAPVIGGNQLICAGGDPIAFTEITPAASSATIVYQWQSSADSLSGYTDIVGATSALYDPPSGISDTIFYRVIANTTGGCSSGNCSDTSNVLIVTAFPCDYGDLPDIASGTTGINNYETYDSTNGPSHQIIVGLFLGDTVDAELDGYPDSLAVGDDTKDGYDDEDGITIFPTLSIIPGGIIRLPLSVTNTTGDSAYIEAWIDWNGDGDFDELNEMVVDYKDEEDGVFPASMDIMIPVDAVTGSLLGFRVRLSNTDNMTPYGRINSGEVEDYLLGIDCPQVICLPIETAIIKK